MKYLVSLIMILVASLWGASRWLEQEPVIIPELVEVVDVKAPGPWETFVNPKTGLAYVNGGDTISVLQEQEEIATLEIWIVDVIQDMAIDEENGWVYGANQTFGVTVISGTEVIKTFNADEYDAGFSHVVVEPTRDWAYVASGYKYDVLKKFREKVYGLVTVVKGPDLIGTIPLGHIVPTAMTVDGKGLVYIGGADGQIIVLDGLKEIARYETERYIEALDVNPLTGDVYALNHVDKLYRFNAGKQTGELSFEVPIVFNLKVNPRTGDVYVLSGLQSLAVVRDMEIIARLPLNRSPRKMAADPVTGNIYIADFRDNSVAVIRGTEVITTYQVGWYPYGLGVDPRNGRLYVSNTNEGTVSIFEPPPQ